MDHRLTMLRSFLAQGKLDAILLSSPQSIRYYTSFTAFSSDEREGYLLITQNDVTLLTSMLYEGEIKKLPSISSLIYSSKHPFTTLLAAYFKKNAIEKLGVEGSSLTLNEYSAIRKLSKIKPASIKHLRMQKTSDEIQAIQEACQVADHAFTAVTKYIKTGISERNVASLLKREIENKTAEISFRPIVAFGSNAAIPHHLTSDRKLASDDLILIDFGARWEGYCSDMTRTFFVGKSTEEQMKVYEVVHEAQRKAIDYLRHELSIMKQKPKTKDERPWTAFKRIKASETDKSARRYIVSQDYPSIPHSLGHGIGLEVHEPPYIGPGSEDLLEEGMVFSIEPGIYLPGKFGVRIEDLFAIQNGELIQLTNAKKRN